MHIYSLALSVFLAFCITQIIIIFCLYLYEPVQINCIKFIFVINVKAVLKYYTNNK